MKTHQNWCQNQIQMLLVHSEDDKVISPASARIPTPMPPDMIYVETKYGGHLGFGAVDLGWVNQVAQKYLLHLAHRKRPDSSVDKKVTQYLLNPGTRSRL